MGQTLAEKVIEYCSTIGAGDYQLSGTAAGVNRTWISKFADQKIVEYIARRTDGTVFELGIGRINYGVPNTITRIRILDSSNGGSAISWGAADGPYVIGSPYSNYVLDNEIQGNASTTTPAEYLPAGGRWWDQGTLGIGVGWIRKLRLGQGGLDVEMGRYDVASGTYITGRRSPFVAVGAANKVTTVANLGYVFTFDTTAAVRTLTLPTAASVGSGFSMEAQGNGEYNGVGIVPASGTEIIGNLPAGATYTTLPRVRVKIESDGTQWYVSGMGGGKIGSPEHFYGATLPSVHVWASGKTIGDATSGATERANLDTWPLFSVLWSGADDLKLPIFDSAGGASTRGATALADFQAHKRLTVPDHRGRAPIGNDGIGGTLAGRTSIVLSGTIASASNGIITGLSSTAGLAIGMTAIGVGIPAGNTILTIDSATQVTLANNNTTPATVSIRFGVLDGVRNAAAGGSHVHKMVPAQMPIHNHGLNSGAGFQLGSNGGGGVSGGGSAMQFAGTLAATDNAGGDQAHPNMQDSIVSNVVFRLY